MNALPTSLKQYANSIFLGLISLLMLFACKKETNPLKQPPLLAKEILGKWNYTERKYVGKDGSSSIEEISLPIPIYNFLDNGNYLTNLKSGLFPYQIKNDTVINFSGDLHIESHQYTVKIVYNNNDTTMQWIGYPPFITRDGDPNLDHILISFNRNILQ